MDRTASAAPRRPVVWVAMGYWIDPIFRGVAEYAAEQGWILDGSMSWRRGPIVAPGFKPDGVIAFTGDTPGLEDAVRACAAPIVDLENFCDRYGAPKVIGDDVNVGVLAARHLAAYKPGRLVFCGPPSGGNPASAGREKGFREEAAKAGFRAESIAPAGFDPGKLRRDAPCAVFANGDSLALGLLRKCLDAGVSVPDEIAILGADDTHYVCTLAPVPLSSVNMDFELKGRRAAELLGRLMLGEKAPAKPVVVPPLGVTVRESTRVLRTGHDATDRLIRHLRENSRRHVRVETLCEEADIPLRTAQHMLKTRMGVSPGELLTRFRLENSATLGTLGTLTRDAIAKAAGFGSRSALLRAERAEK